MTKNHDRRSSLPSALLLAALLASFTATAGDTTDQVAGHFTANDHKLELKHVYVHTEEHPFNDGETAYVFSFTAVPVKSDQLEDLWMEDDIDFVQVSVAADGTSYGHNLKHSAMNPSMVSGGGMQKVEMKTIGPEVFSGRVWIPEPSDFFDNTYQYDATFTVRLDPAVAEPAGEPLPADGGVPGAAYSTWIATIAAGDVEGLKKLVPSEMAVDLEGDEGAEMFEMMQLMTPSEVKVLGGTIDGEEAVLEVDAVMDGEKISGEITMTRRGQYWMPSSEKWKSP
jgi:hypothetical protein